MALKRNEYSTYAGLDTSPPVNWGSVANTISQQIGLFKEDRQKNLCVAVTGGGTSTGIA